MKKFGVVLFGLFAVSVALAQDSVKIQKPFFSRMAEKGILNHMDVGVNVGSLGIGVDVAVPVGNYVRLRAGYNYMPNIKIHSNFNSIETREGSIKNYINKIDDIDEKFAKYGIDINDPKFATYKEMLDNFRSMEKKDYVTMSLEPNLHQFKFLVDVMPFKHNKHWSFTAGFFIGPSDVGYADNVSEDELYLNGINTYNALYVDYCLKQGIETTGPNGKIQKVQLQSDGPRSDLFYRNGMAAFRLGKFDDGSTAMMVPSGDNSVQAVMEVNKFRPYLGFGYSTHLSRNRRWNMTVDGGVMFLFGSPSVYVDNVYKIDESELVLDEKRNYVSGIGFDKYDNYYGDIVRYNPKTYDYEYVGDELLRQHVDIVHDLHDVPGKVGKMVDLISKFKVYPNVSVTFSYRLY